MSANAGSSVEPLAAAWQRFKTVCVTGTQGKTTTTSMLAAILAAGGEPGARMTTLGAWVGDTAIGGPSSRRLAAFLDAATAAGARTIAVEVVSLALATGFARGFPADIAVFTNLLDEHRQTHATREAYVRAKAELFMHLRRPGIVVLNAADPVSAELASVAPEGAACMAYAARAVAAPCASLPLALQAKTVRPARDGTQIALEPSKLADALGGSLSLRVVGAHNADNALAAAVAAATAGFGAEAIKRGLAEFEGLPGRFQIVSQKPWVIVELAHTPGALKSVLESVRGVMKSEKSSGTVTCIFGCGGERNRERRPLLAKVAASLADRVVVTTDNPRNEDPAAIARDIEAGFADTRAKVKRVRELDRRRAIEGAVLDADPHDVVVIAGKGHESVQEVRGRALPWSDVKVARVALARRSG